MAQLRAVAQRTRTSLTELRQWLLSSGVKEKQGAHRPAEDTRRPLRWRLLSRALTVAVYTFGLERGKMLALPAWLRVVSAYSAAATVPMQFPTAHGDNCRLATTIAAACLAGARVSLASASGVSAILCLCPAWIVWWTKDGVNDSVTPIFRKVLKWMDDHSNVLPKGNANPPPAKREESDLRRTFNKRCERSAEFTKDQHRLLQEIDDRKMDATDLETIEHVESFMRDNNGSLSARSQDDKEQNALAQRLGRLLCKETKSQMLQTRLAQLTKNTRQTPTTGAARCSTAR